MAVPEGVSNTPKPRSNLVVAAACIAFFSTMIGVTYASVPLYKLFCQVTGYGGTTQQVEQASQKILDRTITVRFDANVCIASCLEARSNAA